MNPPLRSLVDLLAAAGVRSVGVPDVAVAGVRTDSRRVRPGDLFLALPGQVTDGRRFIEDAVARGAAAVAVESPVRAGDQHAGGRTPVFAVDEIAAGAGTLASAWFDHPSRAMTVLGVTGTNGKTSCTHHLCEMLNRLGQRAGLLGTLGNGLPGHLHQTGLTTADPVTLQANLASLRDAGARWVAMEVSSHALEQERVAGVTFDGALITNLSRDHLDYHGSMEAYGEAKRRLFLAPGLSVGVLNRDDAFTRTLAERVPTAVETLGYSLRDPAADLSVTALEHSGERTRVHVRSRWGSGAFETGLIGEFSISNLLGAITLLAGLDLPFDALLQVADVAPVQGRLQGFAHPEGFTVVVDYAHTPAALEVALAALRQRFPGRLLCVFGCGGERDAGKRPEMGAVAAAGADVVVLTDDNPRGEDGDRIIAEIRAGTAGAATMQVERDRARAVTLACDEARPGDVVLVAGKGHEDYQHVAEGRISYSDVATVEALIAEAEDARLRGAG